MDNINKLMDKAMRIIEEKGIYNIVGDDSHIEADCEDGEVLYHLVLDGHVGNLDDIVCDCGKKVCAHRLAFVLELNRKMENSKVMMLENAFNGALSDEGLKDFVELAINYNEDLYHYFLDMILFEESGGIEFSGDEEYEKIDMIFHKYSQTGFVFQKNYNALAAEILGESKNYLEYPEHLDELLVYILKLIAQYQYDKTNDFYPTILPVLQEIADLAGSDGHQKGKLLDSLAELLGQSNIILVEALIYDLLLDIIAAKTQARLIYNIIKPRVSSIAEIIIDNGDMGEPQDLIFLRAALNRLNLHTRTILVMSDRNTFKDFFKLCPRKYLYNGVATLVSYYALSAREEALDELIDYVFSGKLEIMEEFEVAKEVVLSLINSINENLYYDNEYYISKIVEKIVEQYAQTVSFKLLWELNLL